MNFKSKQNRLITTIYLLIFAIIGCTNNVSENKDTHEIDIDTGEINYPGFYDNIKVFQNGTIDTIKSFSISDSRLLKIALIKPLGLYKLAILESNTNKIIYYILSNEFVFVPQDTCLISWSMMYVDEGMRCDTAKTEAGLRIIPYKVAKLKIVSESFIHVQTKILDYDYKNNYTEKEQDLIFVRQFYKQ